MFTKNARVLFSPLGVSSCLIIHPQGRLLLWLSNSSILDPNLCWKTHLIFNRSNASQLVMLCLGQVPVTVLCHMGDFGCGIGGWTPVMKIDGKKVRQGMAILLLQTIMTVIRISSGSLIEKWCTLMKILVHMQWKIISANLEGLSKCRRMVFFFLKYLFSFQRY